MNSSEKNVKFTQLFLFELLLPFEKFLCDSVFLIFIKGGGQKCHVDLKIFILPMHTRGPSPKGK